MLRIVYLAILPGMVFSACTAWVFADTTRPANRVAVENKPMYSNRPVGFTVPAPYYGTPMAPRFYVPPEARYRPMAAIPAEDRVTKEDVTFTVTHDLASPQATETIFILREPQPEVDVKDELDSFYARLAKIHVEKHQLPDALVLIRKIKSETFKVRTVVSLAEYVSRDKDYQSEAGQLYGLAIAGMEALDRGQPFRVDLSGVKAPVVAPPVAPPADTVPVVPPVVVDTPSEPGVEERPTQEAPDPAPPVDTPPDPGQKKQIIPLEDNDSPPITAPPGARPGPRPQLLLEEDAGRGNGGRLPPPPPPRGNGVDGGIVVSPPGQPSITPEVAPPARTTEDIGLAPPAPPSSSSGTAPRPAPRPPAIPLEDPTEKPVTPSEEPKTEEPKQPQQPPRRPTRIILDEN